MNIEDILSQPLLIDTDVLIDALRGRAEAIAWVDSLTMRPLISVATLAELYAGVREGRERLHLVSFLDGFKFVDIDPEIAVKGGLYRRDYGKSHNVGLNDALIAATAEIRRLTLVTFNAKHFPMLTNMIVPYSKI